MVNSIKKNIIAIFSRSAWSALMGLAFVAFYIKLMGWSLMTLVERFHL